MSTFPIGTKIAINRFPHSGLEPTHTVVGHRDSDHYLRIRPINAPEGQEFCTGSRVHIETYLPPSDAIKF